MTETIKKRIEWMDSLRGISALLVVIAHVSGLILQNDHINNFSVYFSWMLGRVGVITFFLISGFVIPFSLHNRTIKQFAISRFFRLYPAYWVSIILILLVGGGATFLQITANITMFQKAFNIDDLVPVYWTLQIELCFYIICTLLFYFDLLFRDKVLKNVFYTLLTISLLIAAGRFFTVKKLPVAFPLSLGVMFLGYLYRRYSYKEGGITSNGIILCLLIFLAAIVPISFLAYNKDYGFNEKWWQYLFSYLTAIILFIGYSKFHRSSKTLLFFGNISFSLYLLHEIVIVFMDKFNLYNKLNHYEYIFLFLTISVIASAICYYIVEKPFIAIGKKILKKQLVEVI